MTNVGEIELIEALNEGNRVRKLQVWLDGMRLLRQYERKTVENSEGLSWLREHLKRLKEEIDHGNRS